MPIVDAKCTNCGATLQVDNSKEAMVCQYCGSAFVVEKAINNYNTTIINNNNFAGANITVSGGDIENYRTLARRAASSNNGNDALQYYKKIVEINSNDWEAAFYVEIFTSFTNNIFNINETAIQEYAANWSQNAQNTSVNAEICDTLIDYADNLFRTGITYVFSDSEKFYSAIIKCDKLYNIVYDLSPKDNSVLYLQKILDKLKEGKTILKVSPDPQIIHFVSKVEEIEQKYINKMKSINPSYEPPQSNESNYTKSSGCYIATCVYGSYDCPEVWTLRRYRDYTLDSTWYGRAFIHIYYAISPVLVKWFGNRRWFKSIWKKRLDKMVKGLNDNGYDNTRYYDKY